MINPWKISKINWYRSIFFACVLLARGGVALATTQTLTLTAYSSDGQNTGIARLGQTVHFTASVTGVSNPSIAWSVQGAGSISSTGYYQTPSSMPSSASVTVTGTLTSNTSVSNSYSFSVVNPIPAIYSAYTGPGQLQTDSTNPITVSGAGFVPQSVVYANGTAVPTTYQSAGTLTAQVAVAATATGPVSIAVQSPAPGGGASGSYNMAVAVDQITLYAYTSDGTNSGTIRLGKTVQITTKITGTPDTAVNWSVNGAGAITASGQYQAPATMPSNASVTVTATLASNPSASGSYSFSLISPVPAIYSAYTGPGQLQTDFTNPITVSGAGFVPQSVVYANGAAVPTTYQSPGTLTAQVAVSATATGSVSISVQSPAPGGGASGSYNMAVAVDQITLYAYTSDGTNTGTIRLGKTVQITTKITGTPDTAVSWSVSGAGTITSAGVYQAPSTMPSSAAVTITATLAANSAVAGTYSFSLVNPVPAIYSAYTGPGQLQTDFTNPITVSGAGFVPQSVVYAKGAAVPTTYQSPTTLTAQVAVSATATGSVSITVQNPSPGGGASGTSSIAIAVGQITIYAYTSDGANTGSVRLGKTAQMTTSIAGTPDTAVNWSVSGAGTITTAGVYQAPYTMPSSAAVTVTATLASNPAVSSSYSFSLMLPQPSLYSVYTAVGPLSSGTTNSVTVSGAGFIPQSVVLVNGASVPVAFQSSTTLTATVQVAAGAQDPVQFVVQNPAPGGSSSSVALGITPLVLKVGALSAVGPNPGTSRLSLQTQFNSTLTGSGSSTPLPITWILQGAGTLSPNGLYTAPDTMPSNARIGIVATLTANSSVYGSYHISLLNPVPVITHTSPTQVTAGVPTAVTLSGRGFTSNTTLTLNGAAVPVTFVSDNALSASINVPAGQTGTVSLVAQNPDPGGTSSVPFNLPVGQPATVSAQVNVTPGQQIPDDFLGMSYEWGHEAGFEGTPATGINQVYRQLMSNLMQGHTKPMLIRIGGRSSDQSGEPTANTLAAYASMASSMPVTFTLGVSLAANNPQLAQDQASYFVANMPTGSLAAIEIGNEADNFPLWGARPSTYNIPTYLQEFSTIGAAVTSVIPSSLGLMGPSWANPTNNTAYFSAFEQQEQNVTMASVHGYAVDTATYANPTPQFFLSNQAATQWPSQDGPFVATAHQNHQLFRIGEMNSIDNTGITGISNSFSAALWAIDTMFEYANIGVDGVNFHGTGGCSYCQFNFGVFYTPNGNAFALQYTNPLYYGLLLFQQATQNNSQLLPVAVGSGANVKVWATQDSSNVVRVLVLDKDLTFAGNVAVSIPGFTTAQVLRLAAPGFDATTGATFNGQSLDGSLDGSLVGMTDSETLTSSGGVFNVPVQPATAVLLTLGN